MLCLCGCGEQIISKVHNYIYGHRKRLVAFMNNKQCKCGCGNVVKFPTQNFIRGHNKRNTVHSKETKEHWSKIRKGREPGNKGMKMSEEFCQKCSEAHKGLMVGENHPLYGTHRDDNTKLLISQKLKGKMAGDKHYNWKGGPQTELAKQRSCDEYKEWIKQVFKRDQYLCHRCNNGGTLSAHHIFNFSKLVHNNEYLWNVNNGITFCKDCHKQFHYKYGTKNNDQQQIFEFVYLNH